MSDYPRFPNYSQLQSSMNAAGNSRLESHRATRSSLACLPCRSRHLKCDGKQPCSRCADVAKQCMYAQSRRGGLDRAALAERRKRLAEDTLTDRSPSAQQRPRLNPSAVNSSGLDGSNASDEPFRSSIPIQFNTDHIENDLLVDAYYKHFHKLHPFILPQRHLARLSHDQNRQPSFVPLIAVLRLIGSVCSSREWSTPLQNYAEACFSQASTTDPTMVQCRLLYSMVLFWHNYTADAKREMTSAARLAVDLEMFRWEFGAEHGADPVVRESWRRTWWTLCVIDVYYAGTLGTTKFEVMDIEPTMELPCEEADYESGVSIKSIYRTSSASR